MQYYITHLNIFNNLFLIPPLNINLLNDIFAINLEPHLNIDNIFENRSENPSDSGTISEKIQATVISLTDKAKREDWARELGFTYLESKKYAQIERHLLIGNVAILGFNDQKVWGVYTDIDLSEEMILGEYLGDQVKLSEVSNSDYIFKLDEDNDIGIDAKLNRNWTAIVNSTSVTETANVYAYKQNGHIIYKTCKKILKGQQLLIDYGESYIMDEPHKFRFLKPTDTWLDSQEILDQHAQNYQRDLNTIPPALAVLCDIESNLRFKIPNIPVNSKKRKLDELETSVDLPLLAIDAQDKLCPQHQQENLTLLMVACSNGDMKLIKTLLKKSANPNIQSSIHGYTALHLIIAAEVDLSIKLNMMQLLVNMGALLFLQDKYDRTVLHWAIQYREIELVKWLMREDQVIQRESHQHLMNCTDSHGCDAILYAIKYEFEEAFIFLKDYLSVKDIQWYIETELLIFSRNPKLRKTQIDSFLQIIRNSDMTASQKKNLTKKISEFRRNNVEGGHSFFENRKEKSTIAEYKPHCI